jgi:hypothetical protein
VYGRAARMQGGTCVSPCSQVGVGRANAGGKWVWVMLLANAGWNVCIALLASGCGSLRMQGGSGCGSCCWRVGRAAREGGECRGERVYGRAACMQGGTCVSPCAKMGVGRAARMPTTGGSLFAQEFLFVSPVELFANFLHEYSGGNVCITMLTNAQGVFLTIHSFFFHSFLSFLQKMSNQDSKYSSSKDLFGKLYSPSKDDKYKSTYWSAIFFPPKPIISNGSGGGISRFQKRPPAVPLDASFAVPIDPLFAVPLDASFAVPIDPLFAVPLDASFAVPHGAVDGVMKGMVDGAAVGAVDGVMKGTVDGATVGAVDGAMKGMVDGAAVGAVDGAMKGMVDGAAVGALGVLPAEILAPSAMAGQDHPFVSAVAGGAGHFLANQDHSSVSAVAGGAGHFHSVSAVAGGAGHFFNQDHPSVSAVAGGAGRFLSNQDHPSVSAVAGGAGCFLANQDHSSVSAVAGGAGHFFASQDHSFVSAVALKTDAQIARQKKKKRWRKNKKRRINAHQATSPSMIHQEGKTLCVFHQKGFSGWCARGNYDCTCCEGATINFLEMYCKAQTRVNLLLQLNVA